MTVTERELEARLAEIEDPTLDADIVSVGLVNDVSIDDGTATVSLAFNTPYAPAEIEIGNRIREAVTDAGLEPDLTAQISDEHGFDQEVLPGVRNVIAVASGKGGVGKTTVAANLAAGLEDMGARVGILDADVHGPNVPRILSIEDENPAVTHGDDLVPPEADGVRVISMGFLTRNQDDPAIMRGPMVNKVMMNFLEGVEWGFLDYLIVDLPPGTGDAALNLLQSMPVTGAVVVTTPQQMAVDDTRKGVRMFQEHNAAVLGVVENMSTFQCPSCGDEHGLFGRDGATDISEDYDVPLLGRLPLHPGFGAEGAEVPPAKDEDNPVRDHVLELVETITNRTSEINRRTVAEHVGYLADEGDDTASDEDAIDGPTSAGRE